MSEWPDDMTVAPISSWPGPLTPAGSRINADFRTSTAGSYNRVPTPLTTTMKDLSRELRAVHARDAEMLVAIGLNQFRKDGKPYADAKPDHPGVIVSFELPKVGRVSYPCDTYVRWQDNLRAIALALEALRKVTRYKVGQQNQQYRAYLAIEGGTPMPQGFGSASEAIDLLLKESEYRAVPTEEGGLKRVVRLAQRRTHPDANPDSTIARAQRVEAAVAYLRQAGHL